MKQKRYALIRHLSQIGFVLLILYYTLGRFIFPGVRGIELHGICPFGGVETLPTFLASGGLKFVHETGLSNFAMLAALLLAVLAFGGAFCGWVCPVGSITEWLFMLRRVFWKKRITVPEKLHNVLVWFRYVVLAAILYMTFATGFLVFGTVDPFLNLFSFGRVFAVGLVVLVLILIGSMFIERFFCRYLCPLGAVILPFAKLSATGVVHSNEDCTSCKGCEEVCPKQIPISRQTKIDRGQCISCMKCVEECPTALSFKIGW